MATTYDQDETQNADDSGTLVLVFTAEGQAVLEEDGVAVWMSDDDDDFQEQFGNEFLDPDSDSAEILNWLEEEGWIETEEKEEVEIETEVDGDSDSELNNNQE
jgi:hypothetical protein